MMENGIGIERLEEILQLATGGIIYQEADGRIKFLNRAAEGMLGVDSGAVVGRALSRHPWNMVHEDGSPCPDEQFPAFITLRSGQPLDDQVRGLKRPGGQLTWLAISTRPLFEPGRDLPVAVVVSLEDITRLKQAGEISRAEYRRQKIAMDLAKLVRWEYDVDADMFTFDDQFYALYGTSVSEQGGNQMSSRDYARRFLHPDDTAVVAQEVANAIATTDPDYTRQLEHRIVRVDGQERYINVRFGIIKDEQGRTIKTYGANQDITDRRRAEEALRKSQEKFFKLFKASPASLVVSTLAEGRFVEVNDAFCQIIGYGQAELVGSTSVELDVWVDPAERQQVRDQIERNCFINDYPIQVRRENGQIRDLMWSAEKIEIEGEACIVSVLLDVTELNRAKSALEESEAQYRDLFENVNDLLCVHDLRGRFINVNRAASDILGYTREEFLSLNVFDGIPEKYRQRFFDQYMKTITQEKHAEGVMQVIAKNGDLHFIEYRNRLVRPENGAAPYVVGFARDITERKRAEEEKKKLEFQLHQAQKMEAIGTLAGGIAHDFNNILSAIMGYAEIALDDAGQNKTSPRELKNILRASDRARNLVQQILTFSRRTEAQLKRVDINQEVVAATNLLKRTLPKMIDIRVDMSQNIAPVMGDPFQIEQILMNLGSNARDAMPGGGVLSIATSEQRVAGQTCRACSTPFSGEYVVITVSDNGQGIRPDDIGKIFDPFFTTKEVGKGTGLGLSTVFGIVSSYGGHIDCQSRPGKGTTFKIYLPPTQDGIEPANPGGRAETAGGGEETILLVDDEPHIRDIALRHLRRAGYHVQTAPDGEQALRIFQERGGDIGLVILDLSMPGMGGHQCLRELLALAPDLKVIVSTGYSRDGDLSETISSGARALLCKPFSKNELLKSVRSVLDA